VRITVVTPVLDRARVVSDCLFSVRGQTHSDVEHVVVDGGSTDGTLEAVRSGLRPGGRLLTGPDRGLYDALNKGIAAATGEVVGTLGADDVYAGPEVLARVARALDDSGADVLHGDLLYVRADLRSVVRRWRSSPFRPGRFLRGWMPPHPTFFARRELFEQLGGYDLRLRIAADYELMLRFLEHHRLRSHYLPETLVTMRTGGVSNAPRHLVRKSLEDAYALWLNGHGVAAPVVVALKNVRKLPQLFR
jgi:glycosyltransferase involved in cell wall biosynthesis